MAIQDETVKVLHSDMPGAPEMTGESGAMITVLDAILVSGFNEITLDSLVVASDVATATYSSGHGLTMFLSSTVGPVVRIAGATPAELNGDWRVASILDANTFTFTTEGISDGAATGTITSKYAPLGYTKLFSGTDKAVYQRLSAEATAMVLRIDDSDTRYPTLQMYEAMSDVDTGTGSSESADLVYTAKSSVASTLARPWRIVGDDKTFYLFVDSQGTGVYASGFNFGDLQTFVAGDAYHCTLIGHTSASYNAFQIYNLNADSGALARSYSQSGSAVPPRRFSFGPQGGAGQGYTDYPDPATNLLLAWPIATVEYNTCYRGYCRGIFCPLHKSGTVPEDLLLLEPPAMPDRALYVQRVYNTARVLIDITGPWA